MGSMGKIIRHDTHSAPVAPADSPQPVLEVVAPSQADRLGAPPELPVFVIQNDAVYSLKCAVDTEEDAYTTTRFMVRSADLDRFTIRIVRAHGFTRDPFPVYLYVRSLGQWTRRCLVRMQVETTTHFVLECVSCPLQPASTHQKCQNKRTS